MPTPYCQPNGASLSREAYAWCLFLGPLLWRCSQTTFQVKSVQLLRRLPAEAAKQQIKVSRFEPKSLVEPGRTSLRSRSLADSCLFCAGLPEELLAAIFPPPHSARACSPATCAIDSSPVAAWSLRGRSCGPMMRSRSCGWLLPFHAMMSR